jgi:nucleotide-binding universal stress UspA family protein
MYERILVALDGTALAGQALVHAVSIARRSNAHLCLATVRRVLPVTLSGKPLPSGDDVHAKYLEEMAERVRAAGVSSVSAEVFTAGDVAGGIEDHRRKVGASLTVMSTHGRGPVRRAWMGSVADRFLRTSAAPVLLVRPEDQEPPVLDLTRTILIGRVLVALDGSQESEAALRPALELSRLFGAESILVRIVESLADVQATWVTNPFDTTTEHLQAALHAAEEELDEVCTRLRAEGYAVDRTARVAEHVAEGILENAADTRADLIAITTHGRSGLARLALGSVADKVVRAAECPVLVVRPSA